MESIFLPTLSFWENGNQWYGSLGQARFYIQPQQDGLAVELWRGPLTRQLSEILQTVRFPLNEEGLGQLRQWLEQQAQQLNG